ncbi:MAG: hypothetical protein GWP10_11365 [Nitrospiraceae bacterium]|nr:hypothetical protein [Nitrospiraceae bacterium]
MKKFRMFSVLMMALVLVLISTSTLALAKEHQQIRTIVNPVLLELGLDTSNNGRFASSAPTPATTASTTPVTVSSYQEYKMALANALREKQKSCFNSFFSQY